MESIDNSIYNELGARWYEAEDDPVALLRAESKWRSAWVAETIKNKFSSRPSESIKLLDVACGGGFLTNSLVTQGFQVFGIDSAGDALRVARDHDPTGSVTYVEAEAERLPFPDASFDVVTMMDFLEHVSDIHAVLQEARRVLKPNGLFFFHTFNRTWIAKLVVIQAVERFVKNTPKNLHIIELFIPPQELEAAMSKVGLTCKEIFGLRPKLFQWALWRILWTGTVRSDFEFCRSRSLGIGYSGYAIRTE